MINSTARIYLRGAAVGLSIGILFIALGNSGSQSSVAALAYYALSGVAVLLSDAILTDTSFAQLHINAMVIVYWVVLGLVVASIARNNRKAALYTGTGLAIISVGLGVYLKNTPVFG